jgi:hypothetical protein
MAQLDQRLGAAMLSSEDPAVEVWASTAALMMQSRRWEVRMGGANGAIKMIERAEGDARGRLREKLGDEATLVSLSRDEEYRVRLLAGQLASLAPNHPSLLSQTIKQLSETFNSTCELSSSITNPVEAHRRLADLERYLETDLQLIKGLLVASLDQPVIVLLIDVLHRYISGEVSASHAQNKHIREAAQGVIQSVLEKEVLE